MRKIIVFTIFLILGLSFFPFQSLALTVSPGKFVLSADPGDVIKKTMRVRNDLSETITFASYFERLEIRGGGEPVFIPEVKDLASWIQTNPEEITLEGGETGEIDITINVPANAEPGGHYAAIFWGNAPSKQEEGRVGISTRVAVLVILDVSGDVVESCEISDFKSAKKIFSHLPINFNYDLTGGGTVHQKPTGKVLIKNIFGQTKAILDANPSGDIVYPGMKRTFTTSNWQPEGGMPKIEGKGFFSELKREKAGFVLGFYRAQLSLEYGKNEIKTAKASFGFWVLPWRILLISVLILAILLLIFTKGIKKYNQWVIKRARGGYRV